MWITVLPSMDSNKFCSWVENFAIRVDVHIIIHNLVFLIRKIIYYSGHFCQNYLDSSIQICSNGAQIQAHGPKLAFLVLCFLQNSEGTVWSMSMRFGFA